MKPHQNKFYKWLVALLQLLCLSTLNLTCKSDPISPQPPCIICLPGFRATDFQPAWSPDGKTIAYIHGDTTFESTGIYLIDTNGTNKRILFSSPSAYSPTWSPDGEWIAFSDNAQIYKIKVNGDSLTQLTKFGNNFFPS